MRSIPFAPIFVYSHIYIYIHGYERIDVSLLDIGPTPAVAIFSVFSRYKRESSRASVFAAKVLNEAGIRVTMKVGHLFPHCALLADYHSLSTTHDSILSVVSRNVLNAEVDGWLYRVITQLFNRGIYSTRHNKRTIMDCRVGLRWLL